MEKFKVTSTFPFKADHKLLKGFSLFHSIDLNVTLTHAYKEDSVALRGNLNKFHITQYFNKIIRSNSYFKGRPQSSERDFKEKNVALKNPNSKITNINCRSLFKALKGWFP